MPKPLSLASVIEINRLASDVAFIPLLVIEIIDPSTGSLVETARIARNQEPITYRGDIYEAGAFDLELRQEAGVQPTVSLTVRDMTRAVQAKMQAFGGGVGFNVTIMVVASNNANEEPEVTEYFQVVGAGASNYIASFTLGAENALMAPFPRRPQNKNFCPHRYKDSETCKYAGGLVSCDFTLQGPNGCAAHNNTINFGAYPGINRNGVRYA